jgi:transcriptional regulator with GAF, ATPase, and Fis domain
VLRGEKDIKVDVRVSAATNERLEDVVKAGRFPEDLYYRLDVFGIHLPPLRDRTGGVTLLTDHFISLFSAIITAPRTCLLRKQRILVFRH